jgi:hypothetical protein|eukprot:g963.t1
MAAVLLSPPDLVWPKPSGPVTFTKPSNPDPAWNTEAYLSGGWGNLGVLDPQLFKIEFDSKIIAPGIDHVQKSFNRLKDALKVFSSGDVPYTRMKYSPVRKAIRSQASFPRMVTVFTIDKIDDLGEATQVQLGVNESYTLGVKRVAADSAGVKTLAVSIRAKTVFGVSHAMSTFRQLCEWSGDFFVIGGLPLEIKDRPRFPWRGLMVDTSRHFVPLPQLERIIEGMSRIKMNSFHWHIVDSQSFPFASEAEPLLAKKGSYDPQNAVYTVQDVKRIVEYANDRGVRIVPEFDVPAHAASWGEGYPEMIVPCPGVVVKDDRLIEHGVDKVALNPLNNQTYAFLEKFFTEIFSLFPDKYVHFGGDEVNAECWLTNPEIQKWKAVYEKDPGSQGMTWSSKLQETFTTRVLQFAKEHGKVGVLWDEALALNGLTSADHHVIQYWRGWMPQQASLAHSKGLQTVVSPGWYLDDLSVSWQKMYQQDIIGEANPLTLGGEACSWEEHASGANLDHRIFSRLPSIAERLWSPKASTVAGVQPVDKPRIGRTLCHLKQFSGLRVGPVFPDYCPLPQTMMMPDGGNGNKNGIYHVTAGVDAYGGMSPAGVTWRSVSLALIALWFLSVGGLFACRFYGKKDPRPEKEDYSGISYSPVSTEDEEEDEHRQLDGL